MSELRVLNAEGVTVGTAALSETLAAQPIKSHLIHETVVAELAARRAGTHSTKTRSDVRGGGAKPWRQKGTGRARAGSSRSPIWTGGGTVFGPHPRDYGGKVNRKIRRQAFHSALRAHAERGSAAVMEPLTWDTPSTRAAAAYLFQAPDGLQARPLMLVTADPDGVVGRSFRNIEGIVVLAPEEVQTVDLMQARAVLVDKEIWEGWAGESAIEAVTAKKKRAPAKKKPAADDGEQTAEKKSTARKSTAKKSTTKKSTAKKTTAKKAADESDAGTDAPVDGAEKKPASAAKKSTAKKSTAKKSSAKKAAGDEPAEARDDAKDGDS